MHIYACSYIHVYIVSLREIMKKIIKIICNLKHITSIKMLNYKIKDGEERKVAPDRHEPDRGIKKKKDRHKSNHINNFKYEQIKQSNRKVEVVKLYR